MPLNNRQWLDAVAEINGMEAEELEHELEKLHRASFGWALGCCKWNMDEAEEVLQSAYLKILEGKAKFAGKSSLKTWLFGLIRITAAEHRRRNFVRALNLSRFLMQSPKSDQAFAFLLPTIESEKCKRLIESLKDLPDRQREVLELVFYQDMTIEEAANVMGVSLGTARTHYERGKKQLRQKIMSVK